MKPLLLIWSAIPCALGQLHSGSDSTALGEFFASHKEYSDILSLLITLYIFFSFIFTINVMNSYILKDCIREMVINWRTINQDHRNSALQKVYKKLISRQNLQFALLIMGLLVSVQ